MKKILLLIKISTFILFFLTTGIIFPNKIFASDVAVNAAVTTSSNFPGYSGNSAIDSNYTSSEWASNGQQTPWIQLTWGSPQQINHLHLPGGKKSTHIFYSS